MKRILTFTGIGIAALIAVVLLIASTKPAEFRVERSLMVNAPADSVRAFITDFHRWTVWSPYELMDPNMQRSYAGADMGAGAVYTWVGEKVGSGRMEILEVRPEKVTIKLDFTAPFEAHNTADFLLEPQGNGTKVTWAMYGANNFMGKVMSVFFSMDAMVGKDFAAGLQNLNRVSAQ